MRRRGDWHYFERAAKAAEEMLAVFEPTLVLKAKSPLSRPGFDSFVRDLARQLAKEAKGADDAAIKAAAKRLSRNWATISAAERNRVIAAAAESLLKVPAIVIPKIEQTLFDALGNLIVSTKQAANSAHKLGIEATLNKADEKIVQHAATSQGNYITDVYGKRAASFEQRARDIVAEGIDAGLDSATIGQRLAANIIGPSMRTAESYWETVASIHTARARSYGLLSSFTEAGIELFTWVSTMDEATSEQCRFMNGKTFKTGSALQRYEDVKDGADVTEVQPFLQLGRAQNGAQIITAGDRVVARVDEPGFGEKDKAGTYSKAVNVPTLEELGVTTPPAHGRCRSTIVPG